VACKALSPAVNDPYTAVQAIDHLSVIFCALAQRPLGTQVARDGGGVFDALASPASSVPGSVVPRLGSAARTAATIVSLAGSLAADVAPVAIGTAVFPSTRGYVHFQFHDHPRLTVIAVVVACLAWPVVMRISSQPRWLFFRLAMAGAMRKPAPETAPRCGTVSGATPRHDG
jgi:hypothetical protein